MKKIALAGCVIINDVGEILLIHRNTPGRKQWELPGGKIQEGEVPEIAAKRELKEELGVEVVIKSKIGEAEFTEDGSEFHYTWYQSEVGSGEPTLMEDKFDDWQYLDVKALTELDDLSENVKNLILFLNSRT
ncbi:MAG: NUDIX hydrolase [Candidatus Saccharimonadales bacterium]|nr:NUDIX hydrolase [Candidatus Saccharimonadales bacterium]